VTRDRDLLRIGFTVGGLGRGGAELQLLRLAAGLIDRGHLVHVLAYDGTSVLDDQFRDAGVELVAERADTRAAKVNAVRRWQRSTGVSVVHAIMKRASTAAVLARWPRRRPAVVASDYSSATYSARGPVLWGSLAAFALADRVVTETELNRASLERLAPWLRGKTLVVRNGLDLEAFRPARRPEPRPDDRFVFCAVGTLSRVKNPVRVVEAAAELRGRGHDAFRIDWYGRDAPVARDDLGTAARARAAELGLQRHVVFHGDTPEIAVAYRRSDALLHASLQEGFPNAVAEGLASGLPVVVSRVSDLPLVVAEARNGYVFDETDPAAIADAMERLMGRPAEERRAMGTRSRELAERWFTMQRFIDAFEQLYRSLVERRP